MKNKLKAYIEQIFFDAPNIPHTRELKEEMYSNICDRYDDLLAEGKTESAAYNITIAGIGDISELIDELRAEAGISSSLPPSSYKPRYTTEEQETVDKFRIRSAIIKIIAISLFILCWVPLIIIATLFDTDIGATIGVASMMLMISAGVSLLILRPYLRPACMRREKDGGDDDDDDDDDDDGEYDKPNVKAKKHPALVIISTILWPLTLIVYFSLSFLTGAWHLTWMLFLIAAAIESVAEAIFALALKRGSAAVAITKLIIWAVVGVIMVTLLCSLSTGISADFSHIQIFSVVNGEYYPDAASYTGGDKTYSPLTPINSIDIDWTAGDVILSVWEGDGIRLEETAYGNVSDDYTLRSRLKDGVLSVKYASSGLKFFSVMPTKTLTVYLPAGTKLNEMEIDTVSADMKFEAVSENDAVTVSNLELTSASGNLNINGFWIFPEFDAELISGDVLIETVGNNARSDFDISTVSGELNIAGKYRELDITTTSGKVMLLGCADNLNIESVSGYVEMTFTDVPRRLNVDTTSGDVYFRIPSGSGFEIFFDSLSGKLHSSRDMIKGGHFTANGGGSEFHFNTLSGDVSYGYTN